MITAFDINELNSGKTELPLVCYICEKIFFAGTAQIKFELATPERRRLRFCSWGCLAKDRTKRQEVMCKYCNVKFLKDLNQIKATKNNFCSTRCAAKYNNRHKKIGTRRSKIERWIEEQLGKKYPNLDIKYNEINAINAELDIFIPSLRLAFELNGIFHYEPIFGEEKLKRQKNNDQRKIQACLEKNIEICIIDISHIIYFKPPRGEKTLKIITDLIDKKLINSS